MDKIQLSGTRKLGYQPALDGIRGLAVLAVIAQHAGLVSGGGLGVNVFFVLSGFLITCLLLEENEKVGRINISYFYMRRILRLAPALVAVLIVHASYCIFVLDGYDRKAGIGMIFVTLVYMSNWCRAMKWLPAGALGHTWSLAVEEQFYLAWPLLMKKLVKCSFYTSIALITAAIVASNVWRSYLISSGAEWHRVYNGTDTQADSILIGTLAAFLYHHRFLESPFVLRVIRYLAVPAVAFLVVHVLALSPTYTILYYSVIHTLIALSTCIVILASVYRASGLVFQLLSLKALTAIGTISYGLYLWHFVIFEYVDKVLPMGHETASASVVAVKVVIAFMVAILSYLIIENLSSGPRARFLLRLRVVPGFKCVSKSRYVNLFLCT